MRLHTTESTMATSQPPIIDISPVIRTFSGSSRVKARREEFEDDEALMSCVNALRDACTNWGFFQCVNHGISPETMERFDREMRAFFALPRSVKESIKRTDTNSRGWFDDELTKRIMDWKECIDIGRRGWSAVDGENQWPSETDAPTFRTAMEVYYDRCWSLSRALLRACSFGLGMNPNHFDDVAEPHTSYLRLNYYPPCDQKKVAPASHGFDEPDPERDGRLGINKHSDAGCLTVLRQYHDEPASLQVYHDSKWWRVIPVRGALTINIGDMMQVWSNGRYKAPLHRVLANPSRERYSAPFFYNPSYACDVVPVSSAGPPKYKPISWAEFRRRRFEGDVGSDDGADVQISDWLVDGRKNGRSTLRSKI